jgi:hypothetical protein
VALKACRECGDPVSTKTEICPHCGVRSPTSEVIDIWEGTYGKVRQRSGSAGRGKMSIWIKIMLLFVGVVCVLIGLNGMRIGCVFQQSNPPMLTPTACELTKSIDAVLDQWVLKIIR